MIPTLKTEPRGRVVPDAACPLCGAGLRWQTGHLLGCSRRPVCPWEVKLFRKEALQLGWYVTTPDLCETPVELFIARLNQRVHLVPTEPDTRLIGTKPHGGATFKWRILSDEPDPRKRLELQADQFEVNGARLAKAAHSECILATSQEVDGEGQPWTTYHLCPQRDGSWTCDCPWRGFCAHLAGLWRHYQRRRAEGGGDAARVAHIIAQLERQAGIFTVTGDSRRTPAQVQAEGEAAARLLFEG